MIRFQNKNKKINKYHPARHEDGISKNNNNKKIPKKKTNGE